MSRRPRGRRRGPRVLLRLARDWFGAGLGAGALPATLSLAEKRTSPRGGWFPGWSWSPGTQCQLSRKDAASRGLRRRRRFSRDHGGPPRGTGPGGARGRPAGPLGRLAAGLPGSGSDAGKHTLLCSVPRKGWLLWLRVGTQSWGGRCGIQGSLSAGELSPSWMHRPLFSILRSFAL